MALTLVTPASQMPVTLDEAKKQCECEGLFDHDSFLDHVLIPAATDRAQLVTQRQVMTAEYCLQLEGFPCAAGWIDMPRPPLQTVTRIQYVDLAGVTQTLATSTYQVDAPVGPRGARGRIAPAYLETWPATRAQLNAVAITFLAGYGDAPDDVPALLRMAILQTVATWFRYREEFVIETGVSAAVALPRGASQIFKSFKSHAR